MNLGELRRYRVGHIPTGEYAMYEWKRWTYAVYGAGGVYAGCVYRAEKGRWCAWADMTDMADPHHYSTRFEAARSLL